ncbi:DUF892 family protein [Halovivax sp.]|uniref:YciE/YciF ferroxidase family protein n=1 Tax=Halovivax sp. TaxID=1935978 RepID=UPI0025C1F673|nr:DUF892 family protein [Halovivax sp.]
MNTLEELFEHKLRQMYYVETQLVEDLDQMAMKAGNDELSQRLADHRDETREHVSRLETVFDEIGSTPAPTEDAVLDGIRAERDELEGSIEDKDMLDMGYMVGGMMTERVEMTGYEGLLMLADRLEYGTSVTEPLEANHDEDETAYREVDAMTTSSDMKAFWDRITPS